WVCREAYLKATGEGLAELRNIQVQLSPDSKQFQVMRNQDSLTDWHFHQLDIHPSYKAAIAIEAVEAVQLAFYNCYY
ncbi:MAG: 4'-phosphopantetheinyl transferase superfamily protein, partial [Oscillatoriales cyanobacterium RM1_1_9]|nr:4'-phosphopantetheinyl transferase superfamily protein [Oscillatoriales cyanobacterium RM1_1_9]